ncbi:MAG TPA: hypothetical protein VFA09_27565 [Ktedonobacteraceae bacterium]|nr:hypothetical protein [Ktedonobacteraceae bacterium]
MDCNASIVEGTRTTITKFPPGGIGFDWAFLVPCTWLMVGISLDGWVHNHIPALETFFTPWHGVLYSGYLAIAVFLLVALARKHRRGSSWQQALPAGYGLSLFGARREQISGRAKASMISPSQRCYRNSGKPGVPFPVSR